MRLNLLHGLLAVSVDEILDNSLRLCATGRLFAVNLYVVQAVDQCQTHTRLLVDEEGQFDAVSEVQILLERDALSGEHGQVFGHGALDLNVQVVVQVDRAQLLDRVNLEELARIVLGSDVLNRLRDEIVLQLEARAPVEPELLHLVAPVEVQIDDFGALDVHKEHALWDEHSGIRQIGSLFWSHLREVVVVLVELFSVDLDKRFFCHYRIWSFDTV